MSNEGDEDSGSEQRDKKAVGNRTIQLDAISDAILESLNDPAEAEEGEEADAETGEDEATSETAAPPPLPRPKRWNRRALLALLGVVVLAAVLGLLASQLVLSAGRGSGADESDPSNPSGPNAEEEHGDQTPLQLDPILIETGRGDAPVEGEPE